MSPMTGAEMVVTRRRMEAIRRKATPTLWEALASFSWIAEDYTIVTYQWVGVVRAMLIVGINVSGGYVKGYAERLLSCRGAVTINRRKGTNRYREEEKVRMPGSGGGFYPA